MVTGTNESKSGAVSFSVFPKDNVKGVASIKVVAINPDNAWLRLHGWDVPEDAEEQKYIFSGTTKDNRPYCFTRVRFMVQIQDLKDKPIIPMDFNISKELQVTRDNEKCQIIDSYGRTAWATKDEYRAHAIPQYSSGAADISKDYKGCHNGQERLVKFLLKLLNVTPLQVFNRETKSFVPSANPGQLTIDHWDKLCEGDVTELKELVSARPDNCVKVCFGVEDTADNKTYQVYLDTFFGNGNMPDRQTGEYAAVRKAIDKFFDNNENSNKRFSAFPVQVIKLNADTVSDGMDNESSDDDGDLPF